MLEKGFSNPTERVVRLKNMILHAKPYVESERAVLATQAYKENEQLPAIMRRARVVEKIFNELPVTIRPDELIVGAVTINPRSTEICPEFSYDWVEKEFNTMEHRVADPFIIAKKTADDLHEAFKYWPGKTTSSLAASYMSEGTKESMASGVFTVGNYFYGGVGHVSVDYGKILKIGFRGIINLVTHELDNLDRSEPGYIKKEQFYNAVIISYQAAINFAHRYAQEATRLAQLESNPVRKRELEQIAQNCHRVPENGASTFWEACQTFWFLQSMLQIESSGHSISPGRFDQYMYPYLAADTGISQEFAQELVDCCWIKLNDINKTRDEISAQAFAGYAVFQNLCVGGQTEDGRDATNPLTYMCMEATAHVRLPQPSFSIRVWQGTPDEFLFRACELVRMGLGVPAMYNDEVIIPALQNRGVSLHDARDYCIIGCVEPQAPHRTEGWHDAAFFNVAKVLEITLNNGRAGNKQLGPVTGEMTGYASIDDFFAAFKKQMAHFVHQLVEACNSVDIAHGERCPLPFLSALVDDCIGRGKSLQEGGAIYNFTGPQAFGIADTGDSVYAIQKQVFEDRKLSLTELKSALDANFGHAIGSAPHAAGGKSSLGEQEIHEMVKRIIEQHGSLDPAAIKNEVYRQLASGNSAAPAGNNSRFEEIRHILENSPCFGNDIDEVDLVARQCALIYCQEVEKYTNPRGGQFQAGIYPVSANVLFGKDVAALPDGRMAKEPLADGVSPRQGKDTQGPTAAANSVAKLDHFIASNGTLYNQKFLPSSLAGEQGLRHFSGLVRNYFDKKGMHVQFNVIDRKTLIEAQNNPQQHQDLVVRVAGYSAQFVVLAKEVQDDIISRTEQQF
ncbi:MULTISPECIES: glycyl radical diol dehydratase GrpM [Rahnella]|uniref:glycyl radical diol dehydratase GrpM n=1 Tax=Rahnella TaxID=34037 RepID=UPI00103FF62F|nr:MULTISPECIES: glycyl radical diol dehydratase GrpM [Rahnella]TBX34365.1 glycyl radical protein [Rahnella victoriana]TDS98175.1 cobalamin-independent glycerol dehydratase large subunit [Rahnella sp. BIGb0236]